MSESAEVKLARQFIRACLHTPTEPTTGDLLDAITQHIHTMPTYLQRTALDHLRFHLSECLIELTEGNHDGQV